MRIVSPGGTGQIGSILVRWLRHHGHSVQVIGRNVPELRWDGRTLGPWVEAIDGADAVINLTVDAGFEFVAPTWAEASPRFVERWRRGEMRAA